MNPSPDNIITFRDARLRSRSRRRSDESLEQQLADTRQQLEQANARLVEQQQEFQALTRSLQQQADQDGLTGLFNRQKFNALCAAEIARGKRYGTPLALIMFDIDRFKLVNDTYGHLVGDGVLIEAANVVSARMRELDTLARWGGEEFMILAPHTDLTHATQLAELVRRVVDEHAFPTVGHITCSFGVTALQDQDSVDRLIKRADAALYRAKHLGRNRIEIE